MVELVLYEDGERVGVIDPETSDAEYWGDDGAVAMLLDEVDAGITEVAPAEVPDDWEGLRPSTTVTLTGEDLRTHVEGVLEQLGVEVRATPD